MNEQSQASLDAYYAEAASWNSDRLRDLRRSTRIAWWIAGGAAFIAVLQAIALVLLTPLKTVEPYTLLVDRTTGFVQPLRPLNPEQMAPDRALTQSFLVQYVIARESFDLATLNASYRKVALLSGDRARSTYLASMQATNPASPLARYPRSTIVDTRVKSVSPLGRDAALVRFDTIRTDAGGRSSPPSAWVAVVRYRYAGEPLSLEDRFINPLGFQVISYRRDPEALPPVTAAPPATAPAAPPPTPAYYSPSSPEPRP